MSDLQQEHAQELKEVPVPGLHMMIARTELGTSVSMFASDKDFSGTIDITNYDKYNPHLLNELSIILNHFNVHFDPGIPGSALFISRVEFDNIPHFFFKR